jgi:hypothetical protein
MTKIVESFRVVSKWTYAKVSGDGISEVSKFAVPKWQNFLSYQVSIIEE